ncbi:ThiF family adenylyltransferase [Kordiimonas sp. SCSIO 12603]|uniref:ThiF family adenylyltransferase n=1 Tax=Kordiimonas sp. SCSIO 12603 TaxID=2829596 RepID=UPI0021058795|nr:ThiF family adenylyltransferase [Kordiimonas sp. SCSIO 12603]UTW59045.1 ThiF family adenylyltransferase [Kordiimonas sp. SCSIO 12603]
MSLQLINHSPDLKKLKEEGYEVTIEYGHLVIRNIPYVNTQKQVCFGALVSTLNVSGDQTNQPETHVAMFCGDYPCDPKGAPLDRIRHTSAKQTIGGDIIVDHSFSSKPRAGYRDYYEKMSTYASIISNPATALSPNVTPKTHRVIEACSRTPFQYFDNASGRAGISNLSQKLELQSVAIVGLGGTGSYVLDLISKTPVQNIYLYDGDIFEQHNAFRAPGAAPKEQLLERPYKTDYFAQIYGNMHKNIKTKNAFITDQNVDELIQHDFVFICMDSRTEKPKIIKVLENNNIPFIDVGMGLELVENALVGTLRTTMSTPHKREHVHARNRIPLNKADHKDVYSQNIQVADLNALNACLAVIRWKKLYGFYQDTEGEHFSLYHVDGNHILNEDSK